MALVYNGTDCRYRLWRNEGLFFLFGRMGEYDPRGRRFVSAGYAHLASQPSSSDKLTSRKAYVRMFPEVCERGDDPLVGGGRKGDLAVVCST